MTPGPRLHPRGQPARAGDYEISVVDLADGWIAPAGAQPAEGHRFVTLEVLVRSLSAEPLGYRPGQWMIYDHAGYAFEPAGGSARRTPRLVEGYVTPGAQARGWLTFEVPLASVLHRAQFFIGYLSGNPVEFDLTAAPR